MRFAQTSVERFGTVKTEQLQTALQCDDLSSASTRNDRCGPRNLNDLQEKYTE